MYTERQKKVAFYQRNWKVSTLFHAQNFKSNTGFVYNSFAFHACKGKCIFYFVDNKKHLLWTKYMSWNAFHSQNAQVLHTRMKEILWIMKCILSKKLFLFIAFCDSCHKMHFTHKMHISWMVYAFGNKMHITVFEWKRFFWSLNAFCAWNDLNSLHENRFWLNLTSPDILTVNAFTKATNFCTTKVQKLQLKQLVTEAEP